MPDRRVPLVTTIGRQRVWPPKLSALKKWPREGVLTNELTYTEVA